MALYSYNGWLASKNPADFGGLAVLRCGTETFAPGVRAGDVHTVFQYLVDQLNARVEAVDAGHPADDWGYSFRLNVNNPKQLSCHASGTAIDYNAVAHPNGKSNTWTASQRAEIKKILVELGGVVAWLQGYDEMHFEIRATEAQVAAVAKRLRGAIPKPAQPAPAGRTPLVVDGKMGPATIRRWQEIMGTPVDGVISKPSTLISAVQRVLHAAPGTGVVKVDGDFGPQTTVALQKYLGVTADGDFGPKSVKALQTRLNEGRF